jgi:hypothetical protein
MNTTFRMALLGTLLSLYSASAAELIMAKDGSGVYGYKDTPVLPWCGFHVHDPDRPAPRRVAVAPLAAPVPAPADAIVLFDGKNLDRWQKSDWKLEDGCVVAVSGSFATRDAFTNYQLHLEWMPPKEPAKEWYNRGNNGVLLMGVYEIQIFDSYTEKLYPDGQAAAIYGQTPPLVNVCRPPGEWQAFDIVFSVPKFEADKLVEPARVTMWHNGVLVHLNEPIHGETGHRIQPAYNKKVSQGPLVLSGHNCPVKFRNIWLRPL